MKLRLANVDDVKRFYYEDFDEDDNVIEGTRDDETWVDLQNRLSKRQANNLLRFAPREDGDIEGGLRFMEKACSDLITGWSLYDDDGNMIPPSVQVYEQLDAEAAGWLDRVVGKHLRSALGGKAEAAEKKEDD